MERIVTALSLKTKMTLAVSLLTAVLLSILAFSAQVYFADQIKQMVSSQQFTMLSVLAEQIDDKLLSTENELVTAASTINSAVLNDPIKLRRFFAERPDTQAMFDNGLFLFTPQGRLLSGTPLEPGMLARDYSQRDYLKKTLATRRPQISEPFLAVQAHKNPIVMFTAPVFDEKGEVTAILGGSLDLTKNNFLTKLAFIRLGGKGYLYLYNSSRLMIVHKDRERIFKEDAPPGANLMYDKAIAGFEGTGATVNSRNLHVISSFKRLKSTGWILASNFPEAEAYAPVYRAQRYLLIALMSVFLVSFLVVWLSMKHLTAPLVSITRQIRDLTLGDTIQTRISIETGDEIGVLGDAFNLLLEELDNQKSGVKSQLDFSQMLIDSIPIPVFYTDTEGKHRNCNKAFEDISGFSKQQMIGKTISDVAPVHLAEIHRQADLKLTQEEGTQVYEADTVFADGSQRRAIFFKTAFPAANGSHGGVITVMMDITDRKLAEDQLTKLSQAIMQSPVSLVITDLSGHIEFVNPEFTQMSGYTSAEMIGQHPTLLRAETTAPEVYENLWNTISTGQVWTGELHNRQKNGDLHWVHATISPIRNSAGVISNYMAFMESMTERKSLEEQLRQAQKMEAIGQLAGGVAHDFNNILTVIMGFGQLLRTSFQADDPNRDHMDQILDAADRATLLTRSLLAFSRKQVMLLQQLDLNELARKHTRFLTRIIGEDVTLQTDLGGEALPVLADSGQIEQVLMNLATNARDAMPCGGVLCIKTESVLLDKEFYRQHGFGVPGSYARITVSDSGAGMDAQTQNKIFEPFFTTKAPGRGTGLGLSIVYGIIKQHGGYITIASQGGVGTTFSIYLPLIAEQGETTVAVPSVLARGGRERILVVEDDPTVRRLLDAVLKTYGYSVILAESGDEAVQLFEANWLKIDMAILDVIMPGMNGRQVCEELRQRSTQLKVLFLTGYTADLIKDKGILVDGIDLMLKPANPADLARKVREMLDAA